VPDLKQGLNFTDEPAQVFRTRVHQNTFSTVASVAYKFASDDTIVPAVEEAAINEADAGQNNSATEPTAEGNRLEESVGEAFSVRGQVLSSRSRKGNFPRPN
jgi:hypothetical protein